MVVVVVVAVVAPAVEVVGKKNNGNNINILINILVNINININIRINMIESRNTSVLVWRYGGIVGIVGTRLTVRGRGKPGQEQDDSGNVG